MSAGQQSEVNEQSHDNTKKHSYCTCTSVIKIKLKKMKLTMTIAIFHLEVLHQLVVHSVASISRPQLIDRNVSLLGIG